MNNSDTICALATAPGGALGIIRISGSQTLEILSRIFTKDLTQAHPNTIHYGHIKNGSEILDECMVSIFRAPHSYTGEDAAEISCHGSRYILNKILELLVQNGCRMAQCTKSQKGMDMTECISVRYEDGLMATCNSLQFA